MSRARVAAVAKRRHSAVASAPPPAPPVGLVIHMDLDAGINGDGSESTPYNTIASALNAALSYGGNTTIAVHDTGTAKVLAIPGYAFPETVIIQPHVTDNPPISQITVAGGAQKIAVKDFRNITSGSSWTIDNGSSTAAHTSDITLDGCLVRGQIICRGPMDSITIRNMDNRNGATDNYRIGGKVLTFDNRTGQSNPYTKPMTNILVENNEFVNVNEDPVACYGCAGVTIMYNHFGDGADSGPDPTTGKYAHCDGIELRGCSNAEIAYNRIWGMSYQGIYLASDLSTAPSFLIDGVNIHDNLIYCCGRVGVLLSGGGNSSTFGLAKNLFIHSNTIWNNVRGSQNTSTDFITWDTLTTADSGTSIQWQYQMENTNVWNNIGNDYHDGGDGSPATTPFSFGDYNRKNAAENELLGGHNVTDAPSWVSTAPKSYAEAKANYQAWRAGTDPIFSFDLTGSDSATLRTGGYQLPVNGVTESATDFDGTARTTSYSIGAQQWH